LLADITMEAGDVYMIEIIKTIIVCRDRAKVDVAIMSDMAREDMKAHGDLPEGAVFFNRPLNDDELRADLQTYCVRGRSSSTTALLQRLKTTAVIALSPAWMIHLSSCLLSTIFCNNRTLNRSVTNTGHGRCSKK
jgi:hypothetical protein